MVPVLTSHPETARIPVFRDSESHKIRYTSYEGIKHHDIIFDLSKSTFEKC